jgi:signal transduction histidine kinase/DNA-binding response OmpR family regulator
MGALIRAHDWAATPLGPAEGWPQSLRTALSILLDSLYPMLILWGPEYVQFYNDAFRPVLGATKHPGALGQRASECWPEIWDLIGPMFGRVMERGEATWSEDRLFVLDRNGYLEETYFTFCYSAIRDETGAPGGILVTCVETTGRVLGERRLRCLRELAAHAAEAETAAAACAQAARTLADHAADVPFALLYLLEDQGTRARLVCAAGLDPGTPASPLAIDLGDLPAPLREPAGRLSPADTAGIDVAPAGAAWPLELVARRGRVVHVSDVQVRFGPLPGGPWPESPAEAQVLPIGGTGEARPAGLLVAGLSPRCALDDDYRGFLDLLAGQIATAVANARAREEERKRAEALAELDRAKTAFFSNVSHEFRTPLTLALAPVEDALADRGEPLPPRQRERLEIVHRNSRRLLRLVNTLLDVARVEAGRAEASYAPTDLAALTADLASAFREVVERAGLRLVVDCPPLPEPVYVDRAMWEKIALNLLSNAFKFTLEGEIVVTQHAVGDHVELVVRDTGVGIPAPEIPHLFERFYRVRGVRARTHEGSGIGLALVQELVRLHGGTIGVESAPGAGTTVTVTVPRGTAHLPAERLGAARTQPSTAVGVAPFVEEALRWLPAATGTFEPEVIADVFPPAAGASDCAPRARVLVADDNADLRDYLTRLLAGHYAVHPVANGAQALAAARAEVPDLVLSDVMMPELDGVGLLHALRADPRTVVVPVILLSARAGEEAALAGLEAGADDYLVKPFSARELLARVRVHLDLARVRAEATRAVRASEERLRQALAASRMVAWEWDLAADVITSTETLREIYGVDRLDTTAQGFPLVHPEDRLRHEATVRAAAETASGYVSTFRIIRPDTGRWSG